MNNKTMEISGTIDDTGDDSTVYDHVVLAADIGAVQGMFKETIKNYKDDAQVSKVLDNCMNKHIGQMKIAPDYKVVRIFFDQQLNSSTPAVLETPDYTPINLSKLVHFIRVNRLFFLTY